MLSLYSPKWASKKDGINTAEKNSDYPTFVVQGEDAERYNAEFSLGQYVTVIAHAETGDVLIPRGRNLFSKAREEIFFVSVMMKDYGHDNVNFTCMAGEVANVIRKTDHGIGLYIITLNVPTVKNMPMSKANVVYFDIDMALEPKQGDYIYTTGTIHTKSTEINDGGKIVRAKRTSIVVKSLSIIRKQ